MDDKLIRLARKVKTLEDELNKISKIKDLDGLLLANSDMSSRYRKSIAETVDVYKDYISNTKKELQDSLKAIQKEQTEKHTANKKNIDSLEAKLNKVKDDILNVSTSINKSIEDIQKDILKDIKDKNNQILLNLDKKDKELKEVKKENTSLNKDLKALKDLVGKLELQKGDDGKSAYDIACELGFKGTKEEWIKSLHGKDGQDIELRGLRAFSDAPKDNKMYARKNRKWVEVESGGGGSSVQSDWNENDSTSMAYIKNKPTNLEVTTNKVTSISSNSTDTEYPSALAVYKSQTKQNSQFKSILPTTGEETGENITLSNTAELEFIQPPLPKGNSEQDDISYIDVGTWEQGEVASSTGENTDNSSCIRTSGYIPVVPNIKYNMARTIYTSFMNFRFYDSSKNYIGTQTLENIVTTNRTNNRMNANDSSIEITINNTSVAYIRMVDYSNNLSTVYTISTASPNPSYPQPITNVTGDVEVLVQNKNLLDMEYALVGYSISDSTGLNVSNASNACGDNYISVLPNTAYTFSANSQMVNIRLSEYDKDKAHIQRTAVNYNTKITITTTSNTRYIRWSLNKNNGTVTEELLNSFDLQLEEGTTATSYTPYKEQTYTFPLGTQRMYLGDYLADDGIHHVRKELVLDGSESGWIKYSDTEYYNLSVLSDSKTGSTIYGLCNRVNSSNGRITWDYLCKANSNMGIDIKYVTTYWGFTGSSLAEFKSWLAENPITVEYELATEEITPYTTEQQTAYDEIKQALSYEEQTNISGSSDESNPIFSVEAVIPIPTYVEDMIDENITSAIGGAY